MADIIKLLPDSVANQIAAGEVVQRPASAVKELLENSLDAGAGSVRLLIKDGGSTLMQVIDDGCGMSETDARMCWERHATSKIRSAHDLFALQTFGFRGEALASIGAVAQVEMKTRRAEDDAATLIRVEGSRVVEQTITAAPVGTSIAVKNLFYNIPARRNFLKSVTVETRHIMEEFQRQALAHPQTGFSMYNNGAEVYELKPASLKQRITDVLGKKKEDELLQVGEETEMVTIAGYVGAPALCRRTRGEQYLYVNGRFIRSAYFNHAIQSAYEGLAEPGSYPLFVLFLHIDPARVDVNVHPTKTEVKFDDEKHIYNIIKAAIRKALGQFVVQPDLDIFGGMGGLEAFLNAPAADKSQLDHPNTFTRQEPRTSYNPFTQDSPGYERRVGQDWQKILGPIEHSESVTAGSQLPPDQEVLLPDDSAGFQLEQIFSLSGGYWVCRVSGELYIVDQRAAHMHVLFHRFADELKKQSGHCQQLLFPSTLELNPAMLHAALDILSDLHALGFDVSHFGGNTLIINGVPAELGRGDEARVLETLLEDFLQTQGSVKLKKHDSLALSLARQAAMNPQVKMSRETMEVLVSQLFNMEERYFGPDGKPVMIKFGTEFLFEMFRKQKH